MKRLFNRFPLWYVVALAVAYTLPFFAYVICLAVATASTLFLAFLGSFVVGLMLFFPFACIYYAALIFIHTLVDETLFGSAPIKIRALILIVSLCVSAILAWNSIQVIRGMEMMDGELYHVILMITMLFVAFLMLEARIALEIVFYRPVLKQRRDLYEGIHTK